MEIKFTNVGVLVLESASNCLPLNEEEDENNSSAKQFSISTNGTPSRSSYYSSSPDSSNCTPKSITSCLTNVVDPVLVKKKLLAKKEKLTNNEDPKSLLKINTVKQTESVVENKCSLLNGNLLNHSTSSKIEIRLKTCATSLINGNMKKNIKLQSIDTPSTNGVLTSDNNSILRSTSLVNGFSENDGVRQKRPLLDSNEEFSKISTNGCKGNSSLDNIVCIKNGFSTTNGSLLKNGAPKLTVTPVRDGISTPNDSSTLKNVAAVTNGNGSSLNNFNTQARRKRLLSDRGERELEYPVCDARTSTYGWSGCNFLKNKQSGVGLCNTSNDCFLNSVLQSIVHTPQLARFLVERHDDNICNVQNRMLCLNCNIKKHILRATSSSKAFEPFWIRQFLSKFFPSHRHGHQEDAHEMLTLLLGALEPPLPKRPINGLKVLSNTSTPSTFSTPIEQIFGGNLRNQICCDTCGTIHTNYEKIREINLGLTRHSSTRTIELIQDFFEREQLQCFMCKNCKCKRSATRHTTILRAPSVLIVQLKRFNLFGGKNRLPVRPDLTLQLGRFSFNKEPIMYRLNGVIEHIGGGVNFGHYVSAWRGFDERSWFYFDDSEVFPINVSKVENMEPYILFFNRIPSNVSAEPSLQLQQRKEHPSEKRFRFSPFSLNSSLTQSQNRSSLGSEQFQRHSINTSLPLLEKHVQ